MYMKVFKTHKQNRNLNISDVRFLCAYNIFTLSFNWIKKYNIIQDGTVTRYFLKNILKCLNYILYDNFFI